MILKEDQFSIAMRTDMILFVWFSCFAGRGVGVLCGAQCAGDAVGFLPSTETIFAWGRARPPALLPLGLGTGVIRTHNITHPDDNSVFFKDPLSVVGALCSVVDCLHLDIRTARAVNKLQVSPTFTRMYVHSLVVGCCAGDRPLPLPLRVQPDACVHSEAVLGYLPCWCVHLRAGVCVTSIPLTSLILSVCRC